uniref:IscS subfamily cysteine desulfurase n=1 Tax=Chitinophaga skermanii TaxID=331697 RepID=UPI000DB92A2D
MQLPVYLDNNATTPCDPEVLATMLPYFTQHFGNAASKHHTIGFTANAAVEVAREQTAHLIGAEPGEIVFTSGATEAINLALKGVYEMYNPKGNHIITSITEHKAVLDTCHHLEQMGAEVTYLPVDAAGRINLADLKNAIKPTTILISIMYANNEIGTLQPVRDISAIAREHSIIFFCDATQAVGKVPVDVNTDGIDLLALSAHKMYGPKGVGALYVRRKQPRVRLIAQMDGGGHEKGMRSGTLNVPGIVGLGKACEVAGQNMLDEGTQQQKLRDQLEHALLQLEGAYLNGSKVQRLPHVTNIAFKYVPGGALMAALSKTVAISAGSACTAGTNEPSYVLKAIGLGDEMAHASLRFGVGRFTSEEEIQFAITTITGTIATLRAESPLWELHKDGVEIDHEGWHHP